MAGGMNFGFLGKSRESVIKEKKQREEEDRRRRREEEEEQFQRLDSRK